VAWSDPWWWLPLLSLPLGVWLVRYVSLTEAVSLNQALKSGRPMHLLFGGSSRPPCGSARSRRHRCREPVADLELIVPDWCVSVPRITPERLALLADGVQWSFSKWTPV